MKRIPNLFAILAAIMLIASCTLEKRLHQPGWHVEWRSRLNVGVAEKRGAEQQTGSTGLTADIRPAMAFYPTVDAEPATIPDDQSFKPCIRKQNTPRDAPPRETTVFEPPTDDTLRKKVVVVNESDLPRYHADHPDEGERDPLTTILWILSAVSMAAVIVLLLLMLLSSFSGFPAALILLELPFLLFARVILAMLIRKRERNHSQRYRRSRNLVLAVLLPDLCLLLAVVVFFVLLVNAFGKSW